MIKLFSRTFAWLCVLALSAVVLACSADVDVPTQAQQQQSDVATSAPAPTFVRVTVTPVPIDTPTAVPTSRPQFTTEQLADPVFPDWLDPDVAEERPDDEVVFGGWKEFLTNTTIKFSEPTVQAHFCDEDVLIWQSGPSEFVTDWNVTRTAAMSSTDWGRVALTGKITDGPAAGSNSTFSEMFIADGKIWKPGWNEPTELEVQRSLRCLELSTE